MVLAPNPSRACVRYNGTVVTSERKYIYIYNLGCDKWLSQLSQVNIHMCQALSQGKALVGSRLSSLVTTVTTV